MAVAIGGNGMVDGVVTIDAVAIGGRIIASTASFVPGDIVEINAPGLNPSIRSV